MRILSTVVLVALLVSLPACNIVQDIERDAQPVGNMISKAAQY